MNAPNVNEQVKAEAAKTLLERAREKINLVRFFRFNASAKHGVPIEDEKDINIAPNETSEQPQPEPAQNIVQIVKTDDDDERIARLERELERERQLREQQSQSQPPTTGGQQESPKTMGDKAKGILQTLAVLGGLGAAGWTGYALSNGDADKQVNGDQPAHISAPFYSPYQYLEDTGEHLP